MNESKMEERGERGLALYHCIYAHEGFEESAQKLFGLVRHAQSTHPGKERSLFLDIEGHRNVNGGFDADMLELQKEFVLGFLMQFLTQASMPLWTVRNQAGQSNDVPEGLNIQEKE